jgi:hypothetical protein
MVRHEITKKIPEFEFVHDKMLYSKGCDCSHRRRIDHRIQIENTMLAIETDEFAHVGYNKHDEEIRYDDVAMIFSGKWVWIRFNPHSNKERREEKTVFQHKLQVLIQTIKHNIIRIQHEENKDMCEIIKLFY